MACISALLLFVAMSAAAQPNTAPLVGRAEGPEGMPLPGVTIAVAGPNLTRTIVTDDLGRFQIADLPPATYLVTATLPGFLTQRVTARHPAAEAMVVRMSFAPLAEVLWTVLPPRDAYRQATAIAHLRIAQTALPGSCAATGIIGSHHTVRVLRTFKGTLPDVIVLNQDSAGRCRDGSTWQEGMEEPYRVGQEYVVFLSGGSAEFSRMAGPSLSFRVFDNLVALDGFAGVNGRVTLDELQSLLERLQP